MSLSTIGHKNELKLHGAQGLEIIAPINKLCFLTWSSGLIFALINNITQQSSVYCLKIWYPSSETVKAIS